MGMSARRTQKSGFNVPIQRCSRADTAAPSSTRARTYGSLRPSPSFPASPRPCRKQTRATSVVPRAEPTPPTECHHASTCARTPPRGRRRRGRRRRCRSSRRPCTLSFSCPRAFAPYASVPPCLLAVLAHKITGWRLLQTDPVRVQGGSQTAPSTLNVFNVALMKSFSLRGFGLQNR